MKEIVITLAMSVRNKSPCRRYGHT